MVKTKIRMSLFPSHSLHFYDFVFAKLLLNDESALHFNVHISDIISYEWYKKMLPVTISWFLSINTVIILCNPWNLGFSFSFQVFCDWCTRDRKKCEISTRWNSTYLSNLKIKDHTSRSKGIKHCMEWVRGVTSFRTVSLHDQVFSELRYSCGASVFVPP